MLLTSPKDTSVRQTEYITSLMILTELIKKLNYLESNIEKIKKAPVQMPFYYDIITLRTRIP